MNDEQFYSTEEAAKFLRISVSTLQRRRKSGKINPDKFGENNTVFYSKVQLQEFLVATNGLIAESAVFEAPVNCLPIQHFSEVTKLMKKLQIAALNQSFKTSFDSKKKIFSFARLDYNNGDVILDRKFDAIDELILNAIYSIARHNTGERHDKSQNGERKVVFTARNILQHIFGNVPDHFQKEIVGVVEKHIEDLSYMKLTFNLMDRLGNDAYVTIRGEKYRLSSIRENLLDLSVVEFKSRTLKKKVKAYRLNSLPPIFKYAETLSQITSWSSSYMAVPCRKTMQNAVISNYLLTKIALVRNKHNRYFNHGILFDTLHEDLHLDVSTRDKKKAIRDNIRIMLDYWEKIHLITSYKFVKKGQRFYKIEFTVNVTEDQVCPPTNLSTSTRTRKSTSLKKQNVAVTSVQSAETARVKMEQGFNQSGASPSDINASSVERPATSSTSMPPNTE